MDLRIAKEITNLSNSMAPLNVTVSDSVFFKYTIEDLSDLENLLLLLNVSNKTDLQIYMHGNRYPSAKHDEHLYAIGDLPKPLLQDML